MEQWYGASGIETSAETGAVSLVCGALLAGGRSSRFLGSDKQEALFEGEALGRKAASNLLDAGLELIVVGGNRALYAGLDLSFTSDIIPGFGPLSGLHAALSACGKPWLYLLACDMPRFSIAWLKYLLASASGSGGEGMPDTLAVAASFGPHVEPFHALYSKACLDRLEAYIAGGCQGGRRPSIQGFLRRIGALLVPESEQAGLGLDSELFLNINTPEQLTS